MPALVFQIKSHQLFYRPLSSFMFTEPIYLLSPRDSWQFLDMKLGENQYFGLMLEKLGAILRLDGQR